MGWLISFLLALVAVSLLAVVMPTLFGPAVAGMAPILVVLAVIGLGGVWWRHSRRRVDADTDQPDAAAIDRHEEVAGVDDRVET
jgi:hypothetical protein